MRKPVVTKLERKDADSYRVIDEDGHSLAFAVRLPDNRWGIADENRNQRVPETFKNPSDLLDYYKMME